MKFVFDDGGRSKYFKCERVGDCVTRAIANATGLDYKKIYDDLNNLAKKKRVKSSSRNGVNNKVWKEYVLSLGFKKITCMFIGSGCTTHLNNYELPDGVLIVNVSKHLTCVKNGILYDTYDCSRNGSRCVYEYYIKKEGEQK